MMKIMNRKQNNEKGLISVSKAVVTTNSIGSKSEARAVGAERQAVSVPSAEPSIIQDGEHYMSDASHRGVL